MASLYVHALAHNWQALPDNKIFDFIVELDNRFIQHPLLRKELSYYGAIRCTIAEVLEAVEKKQLLQYRVDIAHKGHTFYCRMTMDPMNQVYANWLITIAGSRHRTLRTTNPLKLGDMVETALGLCRFIDEYGEDIGWLLGDPNSMSGRIEASLRVFMESDNQKRHQVGKNSAPKRKHKWKGEYPPDVTAFAETLC